MTDGGELSADFMTIDRLEQEDRTIQILYGIGLKLEYSMDLIAESPEQARAGVDSAIVSISDLIDDVRERIQPGHRGAQRNGEEGRSASRADSEGTGNVRW